MLDELDWELERRGLRFVRYADDANIFVASRRAGKRVMAIVERFLEKRLRLFINPEKVIPVRKDIKNGQEVLCILQGALELVHGEQVIHFSEGDAVHFYANTANQYIVNRGNEVTVVLWVGTL